MGNTSRTVFEFDSEAVKAISEIEKLSAANRQLKKDLKDAAVEANRGNKSMEASLGQLAQKYQANEAAVAHWREQLKAAETQTSKSGSAQQRLTKVMNEGTSAAAGLSSALSSADGTAPSLETTARAAGSVAKSLLPLAGPKGLLALAAIQAVEVAFSFNKASEAKRDYAKSTDLAIKSMREEIATTKDLTDEKARQLQIEKDLGDQRHANDYEELRKKQSELRNERMKVQKRIRAGEFKWGPDTGKGQKGADADWLMDYVPLGQSASWLADGEAATYKQRQRLKTIDKDLLALGQQENLMVERDRIAKEAADKKTQEERDEKVAERVRDKLGPVRGSLSQAAAAELRKGRDPAAVRKDLSSTVGGRFGADEQPALQKELGDIVDSSRGQAFGEEVSPDKKAKSAEQKRLDQIGVELQELQAERLNEKLNDRISVKEERDFEKRELGLQAEQARLQAELEKKNLYELENSSKRQEDLLERIVKALETPVGQTALPPRPRQVPRNP